MTCTISAFIRYIRTNNLFEFSSNNHNLLECQWSKSFLRWEPGFGRREGGVQGALFLANENRLDWLWERAWFQLYWRQAYCVNAIPPTTTTLYSIYSLWHVFSSITFGLCSFLEFFFKKIFFPVPFFAWELNRRAAHGSCDHAFHFETLFFFFFFVREKIVRKELKSHSQRAFSSVWFDTLGMPGFILLRVMWLSSSLWHRGHFTTSTHGYNSHVGKCFLCADREGYFVYADWSTKFLLLFCLAECSPDRDTKHCLDKADLPF